MSLTPAQRKRILTLAGDGWKYVEIAQEMGIPRGSVGRIIHHARKGYGVSKDQNPKPRDPVHIAKDVKPAKYPFAPDLTCPDFAHDELHCEAVLTHGGFPDIESLAAKRRAA